MPKLTQAQRIVILAEYFEQGGKLAELIVVKSSLLKWIEENEFLMKRSQDPDDVRVVDVEDLKDFLD